MAVTASKLGSSPITLDWSNLANISAKTGNAWPSLPPDQAKAKTETAWNKLQEQFKNQGSGPQVGFYNSPIENELSQAEESQRLAQQILEKNTFTDCLLLGIGGSALGPICLLGSLQDRCKTAMRFHFMENPDPLEWKGTIQKLNPATTLVCVVTKSGTTFETIAQLLLSMEWLGKARVPSHLVAITDPSKGDLKLFAQQEGIATLHIAPSIGGRFSVFSPVGLFPAALAGLSVRDLLTGAQQVRDYIEKTPHEKNAIFNLTHELMRHSTQRPTHVCMPYSTRLRSLGDWFVQIWGESLGKDGKGFNPIAAVGATDQHSILQLLRDGPDDKVTFFLNIDHVEDEVRIPKLGLTKPGQPQLASFKLLEGHTLHELLQTEYRATSRVLTKQGRPNITWQIDRLDERSMGALFFAFSVLTAFTGTLWGVNPFDQPGVEEGKVYIRESLNASNQSAATQADEDENSPVARLRRERDTSYNGG